ncbi:Uma2 family endonuclease [Allokutzneria sp. A3M-2-11 16]|uniref:Uma2 family endonuclease n=1 Tax=Allokutzneria sp. A3M-2-11 16 TaxID=2962043 RepID=UPI0020B79405|nr:Uma2 family endonuclease [Allokutzneria sp. A3M-2-11 16]MCP3799133.1 Uma2 family endonuclease [Allokutzneria sp. A3M-2-11 16]
MIALPRPDRLLTIDEYLALGETEYGYTELQEGRILLSPTPSIDHSVLTSELSCVLGPQLPPGYEVLCGIDIDLELVPDTDPGWSRRPDLVVLHRSARRRVRVEGGAVRASEVVLAIEVVSHDSRRTDAVIKRQDYADAGIPHYWMVDPEQPYTVLSCSLAEHTVEVDVADLLGAAEIPAKG